MSALTRERCPENGVPTDMVAEYYAQRASAAMIFTETTAWSQRGRSSTGSANLYTEEQAEGWLKVTDAVHKKKLVADGYTILGTAKRKNLALKRFIDPNDPTRAISTVRAMDEGVDIPNVSMTLQCAYSSKARQGTQRNGRSGRLDYENPNKRALNICLYMEGTQEEKWLRSSQEGKTVINVSSINDININQTIQLKTNYEPDEEIIIEQSNIESGVSRIDS